MEVVLPGVSKLSLVFKFNVPTVYGESFSNE